MKKTTPKKIMAQMYDMERVREYYKINAHFIYTSETLVRADTIKEWVELRISAEVMPDVVLVNGEEYQLIKKDKK